ncbi:MAG: tail fiber protein [Rhizomicrobium sp.]|nr:tail fiber protein [Rhizomicrobium sp.]
MEPFIGQIQPFAFNFAPKGWVMCNGQLMAISQNAALFSLLGTMYGGNGTTNFQLPNLQSRVPVHTGIGSTGTQYVQGSTGGTENVTLTLSQLPMHNHTFMGASTLGNKQQPTPGGALATPNKSGNPGDNYYASASSALTALNPSSVLNVGGGGNHTNIQPYLVINWCIATTGIYPSRN